MRKKLTILFMALVMSVSLFSVGNVEVQAEELGEDLDYSYLLTEDALVGFSESQTWGYYLMSGESIINRISSTKIGAGGATNASRICEVSICSIVERKTATGWARVTSWTKTNSADTSAIISKSLTVPTGEYYRIRSLHYAGTDASSSWTDALPM